MGTNFALPPPPPSNGEVATTFASVEVLFGDVAAEDVQVLSSTELLVSTPSADAGTVGVTVRNIDEDGDVVPGEEVLEEDAFTFERPKLETTPDGTGGSRGEPTLTRVVRALLRKMKREVLENTVLTVHTDYPELPAGSSSAMVSKLPAIAIAGPELTLNRFYSLNVERYEAAEAGRAYALRPPYTVDAIFTLAAADDSVVRLTTLMHEVISFFERNKTLRVQRDPTADGDVEFEMELTSRGLTFATATPNNMNVRTFSGQVTIRGVDIDDSAMAEALVTEIADVVLEGTEDVPGQPPSPVVLLGEAGVGLPAPIPPAPSPTIGLDGPLFQLTTEDDE